MASSANSSSPAAGGVLLWRDRVAVIIKYAGGEVRLPKGRREKGEPARTTALREVAEETGFDDLKIVTSLGSSYVEYELKGKSVRRSVHWYVVRPRSFHRGRRGRKDARRFAVRWMPTSEALSALTFDYERVQLAAAMRQSTPRERANGD